MSYIEKYWFRNHIMVITFDGMNSSYTIDGRSGLISASESSFRDFIRTNGLKPYKELEPSKTVSNSFRFGSD